MPSVCHERPAIRLFAPSFVLALAPTPMAFPNNNFFQEFMKTFIKRVQAPTAPIKLIEARDEIDRPLKP